MGYGSALRYNQPVAFPCLEALRVPRHSAAREEPEEAQNDMPVAFLSNLLVGAAYELRSRKLKVKQQKD